MGKLLEMAQLQNSKLCSNVLSPRGTSLSQNPLHAGKKKSHPPAVWQPAVLTGSLWGGAYYVGQLSYVSANVKSKPSSLDSCAFPLIPVCIFLG